MNQRKWLGLFQSCASTIVAVHLLDDAHVVTIVAAAVLCALLSIRMWDFRGTAE
jgi:hypothetical protein